MLPKKERYLFLSHCYFIKTLKRKRISIPYLLLFSPPSSPYSLWSFKNRIKSFIESFGGMMVEE